MTLLSQVKKKKNVLSLIVSLNRLPPTINTRQHPLIRKRIHMEFLAGCLRSFLGCLLVVLIATIVIFLVKQQDPVNVDSNDTTVSTSTSSRKKHKKSSSSSHKHRSNSNDSDDNDTQDTYSISTPSRSNSTLRQIIQLTNNQLLTLPQLHNKTNHRRKNTTINVTANNNLLHNQQAAILGHSLIKVRKYWLPVKPTTSSPTPLSKIININLE